MSPVAPAPSVLHQACGLISSLIGPEPASPEAIEEVIQPEPSNVCCSSTKVVPIEPVAS